MEIVRRQSRLEQSTVQSLWNLGTKQWDLQKTRDEATKMAVAKLTFFDDRLYVTYNSGALSVIALPAANQSPRAGRFGRSGG